MERNRGREKRSEASGEFQETGATMESRTTALHRWTDDKRAFARGLLSPQSWAEPQADNRKPPHSPPTRRYSAPSPPSASNSRIREFTSESRLLAV